MLMSWTTVATMIMLFMVFKSTLAHWCPNFQPSFIVSAQWSVERRRWTSNSVIAKKDRVLTSHSDKNLHCAVHNVHFVMTDVINTQYTIGTALEHCLVNSREVLEGKTWKNIKHVFIGYSNVLYGQHDWCIVYVWMWAQSKASFKGYLLI